MLFSVMGRSVLYPKEGYQVKFAPIYLPISLHSCSSIVTANRSAYVYWKLAAQPYELCGVGLQLLDAATVRLESVDGIFAQLVDDLQVASEQVRVLVEGGANLDFDCFRQLRDMRAPEGNLEDVAALHGEVSLCYGRGMAWYSQ